MRDSVVFGPTHIAGEPGLPPWDAGLLSGAVFVPSEADVGSAKRRRGHPPETSGLNLGATRPRGFFTSLVLSIASFPTSPKQPLAVSGWIRISIPRPSSSPFCAPASRAGEIRKIQNDPLGRFFTAFAPGGILSRNISYIRTRKTKQGTGIYAEKV